MKQIIDNNKMGNNNENNMKNIDFNSKNNILDNKNINLNNSNNIKNDNFEKYKNEYQNYEEIKLTTDSLICDKCLRLVYISF